MALTQKQVQRLEIWKAYWRPVAGYVAAASIGLIIFTVCFAVIVDSTNLSTATTFFIAALPSLCGFLSAQAVGRSWEKKNDSAHYSQDDMHEDSGTSKMDPSTGVYITPQTATKPNEDGI